MRAKKTQRFHTFRRVLPAFSVALVSALGCTGTKKFRFSDSWEKTPSHYTTVATQIEYPGVRSSISPTISQVADPLALQNPSEVPARELTLPEAIQLAFGNGEVLRSLGGSVVQAPAAGFGGQGGLGLNTKYDPAIADTNPLGGVDAALSAFDAQVSSQLFWQVDDRPNNVAINPILLNFQRPAFQSTNATFNYQIAKQTATGATFAARHVVNYDLPNTPNRLFSSGFAGFFEAEVRQPLARGAGIEFNRIAGPNSTPGNYNGILIARVNTDISLTNFESGIINFANDVETAYWELYFAYHNLESQVAGRNSSLLTWQRTKELQKVGARGGDAAAEAQARSQYYQFEVAVKEALTGPNGLYAREQALRYLLGMPPSDGTLLKPISEPMEGRVLHDWNGAVSDALYSRVEIRRQKWTIKRRELEMIAARLNRKPTFDFVGSYRYVGLGDALIDSYDSNNDFNSLYQSIFDGDFQEWRAGVELGYPVGLRLAGAAVANARWNLARENALLKEQELRIVHDLSTSARQIERAFALMQANYNRQQSDRDQVDALQLRYERGLDNINFLLQAQQQLAASQSAYFRSLVDYQLALRDFQRERGALLSYNQIGLSEGAIPGAAYQDAVERGRFFKPRQRPDLVEMNNVVSQGPFDPSAVGATSSMPMESAIPMVTERVAPTVVDAPSPTDRAIDLDSTIAPTPPQ